MKSDAHERGFSMISMKYAAWMVAIAAGVVIGLNKYAPNLAKG